MVMNNMYTCTSKLPIKCISLSAFCIYDTSLTKKAIHRLVVMCLLNGDTLEPDLNKVSPGYLIIFEGNTAISQRQDHRDNVNDLELVSTAL